MEQKSQEGHQGVDEEVVVERVHVGVVAQAEGPFEFDGVDQVGRQADEGDFEDGVVERDPVEEQVDVAGQEDHQVDLLGAVGEFSG